MSVTDSLKLVDMVEDYRNIRDELDAARKAFTKLEAESKQAMDILETKMLNILNEQEVESVRTRAGTVFKTTKTYARMAAGEDSKQLRIKWMIQNDDFGLMTSHVNKTHAKELLDEGVNLADAGVEWIEEFTVSIRKPT